MPRFGAPVRLARHRASQSRLSPMGCTAERDVGPRVQFGLIFDRLLQAGDEPSVGFGYDREGESAGLALARSLEIASRQGLLVGILGRRNPFCTRVSWIVRSPRTAGPVHVRGLGQIRGTMSGVLSDGRPIWRRPPNRTPWLCHRYMSQGTCHRASFPVWYPIVNCRCDRRLGAAAWRKS